MDAFKIVVLAVAYLMDMLIMGGYLIFFFIIGVLVVCTSFQNRIFGIFFILLVALASIGGEFLYARHNAQKIVAACNQYKKTHNKYPDKLEDLSPKFIEKIPRAKILSSMGEFSYHSSEDQHVISWSIVSLHLGGRYYLEKDEWTVVGR